MLLPRGGCGRRHDWLVIPTLVGANSLGERLTDGDRRTADYLRLVWVFSLGGVQMTRPKSNRGGARPGGGPRGPRKGQPGAGRPPVSDDARSAVVAHLEAGGTVSGAAVAGGVCRPVARRIANEAGIVVKSGRPKKTVVETGASTMFETFLPVSEGPDNG